MGPQFQTEVNAFPLMARGGDNGFSTRMIPDPNRRHGSSPDSVISSPKGARRDSAPAASERIGASILLIDDDPAVRESLRRVLATEGWQVITAKTGEAALQCLCDHEPDLMITDLCMAPVAVGICSSTRKSSARSFRFCRPALRSKRGRNRPFRTEFFQKPVDLDALLAAIRHHLGECASASPCRDANAFCQLPFVVGRYRHIQKIAFSMMVAMGVGVRIACPVTIRST